MCQFLINIDTHIVKLIKTEILPAITHVINLSISSKKFPTAWKKSKVVPLHKKGDTLNPKNYRPVAIVPILSKILERIIFNQMIQYLNQNNLLHPNHHAYRAEHNTTTTLVRMYDGWVQAVEAEQLAGACMLDMSAAFDLVDHELLIQKLAIYGFDDNFLGWIRSYLSDRSQCVIIEGSLSKLLPVDTGVPQGSILGPLLYTIFTNELPEIIHEAGGQQVDLHHSGGQCWPAYHLGDDQAGSICCYADDTTLTCTDFLPANLSMKLTKQYMVVADYMKNNKLKLNDDKTNLVVMGSSQSKSKTEAAKQVEIRTPTEIIKPTRSQKLLGCWIDSSLKWSDQIRDNEENLIVSLNTRLGALKRISKVASFKNRKMLANGIFMSKLTYLIALWGGCGTVLKRSLQIIQNKVARSVTRLDWSTPSEVLLQQVDWLSVNQLIFFHSVILVYKVIQTQTPKYLHKMFDTPYTYDTRQARGGQIRFVVKPRMELGKNSFRCRGANQFNQLPDVIRASPTLLTFKAQAKNWIRRNVPFQ